MTRRDRLRAALAGARVDRVPVSAWGHFYTEEADPDRFVVATANFQQRFDWDFLKVHSRASYHVEGWGFRYSPSNDPAREPTCAGHPIASAADWRRVQALSLDAPALVEQLRIFERLRQEVGPELPLIMTVYSPLDVAMKLVDGNVELLKRHLDEDPAALESALASIARTFAPFVRELARLGADGVYFPSRWANRLGLTAGQYERLVRPHDLEVLSEVRDSQSVLWCNILHLCEDHVQLRAMADYPVQVFHWDNHAPGNPSFREGKPIVRMELQKAMSGGVDPATLASGDADEVERRAIHAIREVGGRGFLLGPGCSVQMSKTPPENLLALRRAPALAALEMQH